MSRVPTAVQKTFCKFPGLSQARYAMVGTLTVDPRRNGGNDEHKQKREPEHPSLRRLGLLPAQEIQERQVRQQRRLKQVSGEVARERSHRPRGDIPPCCRRRRYG